MAGPRLEPELARQLFFEGAAVVVLGLPEGAEFGIDYSAWTVGPRFRGVKMIPPGIHFLHCSAGRAGGSRETGPRTGCFLSLQRRERRVLRWDTCSEAVGLAAPAAGEAEALAENLQEMDRFLGPYPYETLRKWVSLTSYISEAAVERLQPESGRICAFSEVLPVAAGRHASERAEQRRPRFDAECRSYAEGLARLPRMEPRAGTEIRFTELPKQTYPDGATPEEITRHSMDLSYALERVIRQRYAGQALELLAELQFAFICFLIGNVYDAFEHWKRLLNILCRSEDAIGKYQDLYINLISVLYHQLNEIPADFFVDIVSQDNFLTSTLQVFFSFTCSAAVDGTLRKKAEKFKAHLTKKFKWDFEAEPDDCAPIVVELPEGVQVD
ncbi:protein AAR2 homolog isoform X1 [Falco biarmicus]|uniref:protein AAR2 homolog isoform X1 n=1 Tax=Falco peregrinus TaxID=8954 RepID=UPI0018867678|nr:protein AAR2 homolog isoform X1 [Falco peregrinus]XP_005435057.3 protein AAR2 homolog isoform X1 [Falco cherrug]XP_037258077.1 protein AAR2 homolog isoform X1 [Falco rusticolus]XP_056209981.1 protein AAR2 homolog isoform X1 [Falco biarmicus]